MIRTSVLVGIVLVAALVGVPAVAGGADDPTTLSALAEQIVEQTDATASATELTENIWVPRVTGLGAGLALGLVAGGLVAYVTRGGDG